MTGDSNRIRNSRALERLEIAGANEGHRGDIRLVREIVTELEYALQHRDMQAVTQAHRKACDLLRRLDR